MDDDKGDYRENPVRTHLRMAPSEERVLPERRQVLQEYEQAAWKSNRRRARGARQECGASNVA